MKLINLSYKDEEWELQDIEFEDVSLIVGINSTGKSKTLSRIDLLGRILIQKANLPAHVDLCIGIKDDKGSIITYTLHTTANEKRESEVIYENLKIDGVVVLSRSSNEVASIYNDLDKKHEEIYPPASKLVIHTNRDVLKYPYFEQIITWAESSYGFKFGNISPDKPFGQQKYNLLTAVDEIPELYKSLEEQNEPLRIMPHLNSIGFDIENIILFQPDKTKQSPIFLFVEEANIDHVILFNALSQGLFRCMSLLIFLEYLIAKKKPATIIIDDLCEGLDYHRATKLGELVFRLCLENDIQLIATSNDAFLMETIELKYWNVLQRKSSIVTALNHKKNEKIFQDFKFTGLSNFDFFSSDYLNQKID